MIEPQELEGVDRGYFDIVEARDYIVVLHSKNTCHDWYLLEQVYNGHRGFLISHRHSPSKPYHPHRSRPSISECCDYIKDHDAFHLRRMQAKEARRRRRILVKRREKEGIVPL